jgi:hypothetical protein
VLRIRPLRVFLCLRDKGFLDFILVLQCDQSPLIVFIERVDVSDHRHRASFLLAGKYSREHVCQLGLNLRNRYLDFGHVCEKLLEGGKLLHVMASEGFVIPKVMKLHEKQVTCLVLLVSCFTAR